MAVRLSASQQYPTYKYILNFYNENLQPIYFQGYESYIRLTDLGNYPTEYL